MLTKEDYMRLPKERLAEMLVEKDAEKMITTPCPYPVYPAYPPLPWTTHYTVTDCDVKTETLKKE